MNQPSLEAKRKFIKSLKADGFKVKTDMGWSPIKYCHKTIKYRHWELITTRHKLKCADTHIVFRSNELNEVLNEIYVKDLKIGDLIFTIDGYDTVVDVKELDEYSNMYDLELDDENHRFYTSGILSHNSSTTRAYLLWYAMFNKDKVVAVLANKLASAQEQLQQLRDSYAMLPFWMQPGCRQWNKRGIQFSHGTRIICSATSTDNIRGLSLNLLWIDEMAFIKDHIADEFLASVFPTIVSGHTTKIIISSTPNGLNGYFRMWEEAKGDTSDEGNGFVRLEIPWNAVPGRDAKWAEEERRRIGEIRFNQEYLCQFIGSISTLIDHNFLQNMKAVDPLKIPNLPDYIKIWELPRKKEEMEAKNFEYIASLDSGYGMHADNTVLQIFLAKSNITLHQVAKMSSNSMDIEEFCKKANALLSKYHNPSLIIEQNGPGLAATNYFHTTAEYENLIHFDPSGRHMGMWATDKLKENACILLKAYVQRKFLKIYDNETITELYSFGKKTAMKWGALGGNNDDHVTALYWIVYYVQSPYFYGNIVEVNLKSFAEDEIVLGTMENKNLEEEAFNNMKNPSFHKEELSKGATYLPEEMPYDNDSLYIPKDNPNEDNSGGALFFRR